MVQSILLPILLFSAIFKPGATGYTFLKLGIGVRPVAMGGAFTAISDDADGLFWNPGGLGIIKDYYLSGMVMNHLFYFNYYNLAAVIPITKHSGLGIGLSYLGAQDIEYSERGEEGAQFINSDMLLNIGYGYSYGRHKIVSFGGCLKVVRSQLHHYTAYGGLLDLGVIFNPYRFLYFGTTIKNLGSPRRFIERWEYPPVNFRQGVALKLPFWQNQFTLSFDYSVYPDVAPSFCLGAELRIHAPEFMESMDQKKVSGFSLMAGYRSGYGEGTLSGLSFGFSLEMILAQNLFLDIGILALSYGYLGTSGRIGLGLHYVPRKVRARK